MPENALGRETSPYLLQHRDNPVHWQPWGPAALARAGREDRPILLSVGYAACHWCHVMAHESFEDPETAALMNRLFVNIKVDREERPDIDAIYQTALALIGEPGGWPLTMFLTPRGEPFFGGTYYPPTPRFGRPAFRQVLDAIGRLYRQEPDRVLRNTQAIRDALSRSSTTQPGALPGPTDLDHAAQRLAATVDPVHGGLGEAPKFPHAPALENLWRAHRSTGARDYRDAVIHGLTAMCQGGIYDHLGGGFARYATDAAWLVPHFEKMLYDNAALLELLAMVWTETRDPLFRTRAEETVGWLLRDMGGEPDARGRRAFAASLDADSEGEEGRFYVWRADEIDEILGPQAALFKTVYGVSAAGNWEGRNILHRAVSSIDPTTPDERDLAAARERLRSVRAHRVSPGLDDKILADWNGLLIAALARAARVFGHPDWLATAEEAFAFVASAMQSPDGRLRHSYRAGEARHMGTLDDHAALARAAVALYECTGDPDYLSAAHTLIAALDRHFWDADHGGYYFTADDAEALIARTKSGTDAATPNGNAQAVETLARLYFITGEDACRARAEAILTAFAVPMIQHPFAFGTMLNAACLLARGMQAVIVGEAGAADTRALLEAAWRAWHPDLVIMAVPATHAFPAGHPASGKTMVAGRATAYVCVNQHCSLPVQEGARLAALIDEGPA